MTSTEWIILAIAAVGWVAWVRGCFRVSAADCILGLLIGCLSCAGYFAFFSLTRAPYLAAMILVAYLLILFAFGAMRRSRLGRTMLGACLVLIAAAIVTEYKLVSAGNSLLVIEPYRVGKQWAFDEPLLHLKHEPFVQGIPEMIDKMVTGIPGADRRVRMIFSQQPFPGSQHRLDLRGEQDGGHWYYSEDYQMQGWLCPALFKFFPRAPRHIYVRAEEAS